MELGAFLGVVFLGEGRVFLSAECIGVIFVVLVENYGPGLPGGLIVYQGHLFALKGHLWPSEDVVGFV